MCVRLDPSVENDAKLWTHPGTKHAYLDNNMEWSGRLYHGRNWEDDKKSYFQTGDKVCPSECIDPSPQEQDIDQRTDGMKEI